MSASRAHDDLMEATYRALCEHGFAELTMADIAAETDRSKSTLHYHFDTKRELLGSFLEYLFERFTERIAARESDDPLEELLAVLDAALSPPAEGGREFETAILELRAQAPYDDAYREQLATFDRYLHGRLAGVVREGIDEGAFREVDPEAFAALLVATVDGATTRRVTLGTPTDPVRVALATVIETALLVDDDRSPEGLLA